MTPDTRDPVTPLTALDWMSEPRRIVNENFGWDFMVRSCKACSGEFRFLGEMPPGWSNAGHTERCWLAPALDAARQLAGAEAGRPAPLPPANPSLISSHDSRAALQAAPVSIDPERLAKALGAAEVGCVGFGGFHNGNDATTHHVRDAARVAAEYERLSDAD